MQHLDRYTPAVCSELRQIAEHREWRTWDQLDFAREDLLEDLELTYHLHRAAEASGARAGLTPMPPFPLRFTDKEGLLDPAEFIKYCSRGRSSTREWNHLDNGARTELFNNLGRNGDACVRC